MYYHLAKLFLILAVLAVFTRLLFHTLDSLLLSSVGFVVDCLVWESMGDDASSGRRACFFHYSTLVS